MQDNHCDCPGVAQHALVWGSGSHVQLNPTKPARCAQPIDTALQSDPSQKSDKTKSPKDTLSIEDEKVFKVGLQASPKMRLDSSF